MKVKLIVCFLFVIASVNAQNDNKIVIGKIDSIYSKVLNEQRKIWVSVPPDYNSQLYGPKKYPVLYLLDGDAHFQSVTGILQQLSSVNGNAVVPEMIVVAIPNTDRTRDLTPTHSEVGPDGKVMAGMKSSGGGEMFTKFIKDELIPHIDSLYPTAPYKMFVGHSLGGLLVINTLINHPELFNSYVAIDPSMWWDHQRLLKKADTVLQKRDFAGKTLFLAVANTMAEGMDTSKVTKDTADATLHIRSNLQLAKMLQKYKSNQLTWNWKYYNEDNHGSVPLIAEYDALHSIFKPYSFRLPNSPDDTTFFTVNSIKKHYEDASNQMGYKVLPPQEFINSLAEVFSMFHNTDKSKSFLQLNTDNYPLTIKEIQLNASILQKYVGEYELFPGFILTVRVKGTNIYVQATGQDEEQIYADKEDHFFLKVEAVQIEFIRNNKGEIERLVLHQNGSEYAGKKIK